jgi:hypothetical protein
LAYAGRITKASDLKMDATPKWGVQLLGHPFDLEDWADVLKPPFDPWVERSEGAFVLRWSGFEGLETASEVQEHAAFVIDQLNGAMWIDRATQPLRLEGILAFKSDRTRTTVKLATGHIEARSRTRAVATAIMSDGTTAPSPAPTPSNVQEWTALAEAHELLANTLIYFARAEWFDIYKAVECLEDWVGGEETLCGLCWIKKGEFKRLKRMANSFRHRRGGKHSPPKPPMTKKEARRLLATLISKAFIRAKGSASSASESM